jgi:hypothetical protein
MRRLAIAAAVLALVAPACGGSDADRPDSEPPFAGTGEVVFGMIGDRFVVGSGEQRARQAAELEAEALDGARGAAAAWADLSTIPREALTRVILFDTVPLGELLAELEASTEGLEGRLRVEVPGGLE